MKECVLCGRLDVLNDSNEDCLNICPRCKSRYYDDEGEWNEGKCGDFKICVEPCKDSWLIEDYDETSSIHIKVYMGARGYRDISINAEGLEDSQYMEDLEEFKLANEDKYTFIPVYTYVHSDAAISYSPITPGFKVISGYVWYNCNEVAEEWGRSADVNDIWKSVKVYGSSMFNIYLGNLYDISIKYKGDEVVSMDTVVLDYCDAYTLGELLHSHLDTIIKDRSLFSEEAYCLSFSIRNRSGELIESINVDCNNPEDIDGAMDTLKNIDNSWVREKAEF